jgi:general secretion pathway protein A
MYRHHFGLTRLPFTKELSIEDLFPLACAKELEVRLNHLLEMRGIGLVTGDVGSGKTTGTRRVIGALHGGRYRVFYVCLTTGNVMDLFKSIAWEMGLPTERSRAALHHRIKGEVARLCSEPRLRPVLVVDEAQHLRPDVLEDLRLLTNYDMDSQNRFCLILVGQGELRRRLGMSVHEALNQRIVMRYHVTGLTREELPSYLTHHLKLAGTEHPLFEPAAIEAIFQMSDGLLRKVNGLAHHAMLAAAIAKSKSVSADHVQAAIPEVT